jgi:hypothetical protein
MAAALVLWAPAYAVAQPQFDGYTSLFLDHLPNTTPTALELRARVFAELTIRPTDSVTLTASGYADGLAADRGDAVYDGIVRALELQAEVKFRRVDLQAGLGRVVWGRLDELQPSDVINPLDVSRFFFEGRSEARLPVALVRARVFLSDDASLEGVYVPIFRRGRFDQLDEPTSPFNLLSATATCLGVGLCPEVPIERLEPARTLENAQGGLRFNHTIRRVDYSVSVYRGFRPFGTLRVEPPRHVEEFPRFTMISADFEAIRGPWAFRGEAALFDDDLAGGEARSWDVGLAIDRRAGDYRLNGSILVHDDPADASVSLIFGADRSFAHERYTTRTFGVVNVSDGSSFLRNVTAMAIRDNVSVEGSIGWFIGESRDTIGRFSDRDFVYARLKVYF